jgi:hypothetical protein
MAAFYNLFFKPNILVLFVSWHFLYVSNSPHSAEDMVKIKNI